ncbi:hypothetical protein [Roseobacter litoralis]|uniref:hypothetical protein n=1 Tax=Roseobacter litoralis TaxID=42443 RepID=UPI000160E448|nr:hypothetical protein [Roseobacter litoralis]
MTRCFGYLRNAPGGFLLSENTLGWSVTLTLTFMMTNASCFYRCSMQPCRGHGRVMPWPTGSM